MGRKIALVVGNNLYSEPYQRLEKAVQDASKVAAFLERDLGFKTEFLDNRTAAAVVNKLVELVDQLEDDSQFFFYFAGHGLTVGQTDKQSLLCADATALLSDGVIGAPGAISPEVLVAISLRGRGDKFFCLDSCRGRALHKMDGGPATQNGVAGLGTAITRDATGRPGGSVGGGGRRLMLCSCKDGQTANDDGVFARELIAEMERLHRGGYELKLGQELVDVVQKSLKSNQTPVLYGEPFVLESGRSARAVGLTPRGSGASVAIPSPEVEVPEILTPPTPKVVKPASELTEEAIAAYNAGRYEESERLALDALEVNPNYARAKVFLPKPRKKLETSRKVAGIVAEGRALLESGPFSEALSKADEALKISPDDPDAERLKRDALAKKDDDEIAAVLKEGWTSFYSEDPLNALIKAQTVSKRRPGFPEAKELEAHSKAYALKPGTRVTLEIKGVKYAFRWIPPGSFMMGYEDKVQHRVNITRGFWMLESPITQGMWASVTGEKPSYNKGFFKNTEMFPVEQVSWNDCQDYVKQLNDLGVCPDGYEFSLPTEAEWEYACRAGTTTAYWFGDSLNGDKANCDGTYPFGTDKRGTFLGKTTEVGKYGANAWGLVDTHGNVREWVRDWFGDYPTGEVTDPTGPEGGSLRVGRGGSWVNNAVDCRAAYRDGYLPDYCYFNVGARLVLRPLV